MANYAIPSWIQPPESIAGRYLQGVQIGNEIQNQRAQLAEAQNRSALNASIQQQQLQQQALAQQQRLEVQKAYDQQQIALEQQKLQEVQQINAVKTQQAARQFQAQQAFQQRVASGEDPADVLMQLGPQMGMHAGDMGAILRSRRPAVTPPPQVQNYGGQDYLVIHEPDGKIQAKPITHKQERPVIAGGVAYHQNDDGSLTPLTPPRIVPPKLSDSQKALLGSDVAELKGIEKRIGSTEEHGFGLFHPLGGNKSEMDALRKRAEELRQKIKTEYSTPDRSSFPKAPVSVKDRVEGETYLTPKGPHTWTGKGWKVPEPDETDESVQDEEEVSAE